MSQTKAQLLDGKSSSIEFSTGSASSPTVSFTGDTNTGIYSPGADQLAISTNGTGRISINADGDVDIDSGGVFYDATNNRLGIGTSSPGAKLSIQDGTTADVSGSAIRMELSGSNPYWEIQGLNGLNSANRKLNFYTSSLGGANVLTLLQSGNVGIGTTSPGGKLVISDGSTTFQFDPVGGTGNILRSLTSGGSRDSLLFDASQYVYINGATEYARIDSSGRLLVGTSSYSFTSAGVAVLPGGQLQATKANDALIEINRLTSDGSLVGFYQDTNLEGSISVSGSTVSYNGAHLSRWSQLPSGAERTEILRGTVLSNIDEMCEWGEEENEQLNRMKVSDVEGDKNVSGVFQAWDDDDDTYTNDFYCAMTGDFIIRIAAGVAVERGDLLMSAGDGTAKPQDDDIIRSKTIAKVTSTNVSCTYEDGSYCVPCVLMAC